EGPSADRARDLRQLLDNRRRHWSYLDRNLRLKDVQRWGVRGVEGTLQEETIDAAAFFPRHVLIRVELVDRHKVPEEPQDEENVWRSVIASLGQRSLDNRKLLGLGRH